MSLPIFAELATWRRRVLRADLPLEGIERAAALNEWAHTLELASAAVTAFDEAVQMMPPASGAAYRAFEKLETYMSQLVEDFELYVAHDPDFSARIERAKARRNRSNTGVEPDRGSATWMQ